jgi:hypothetical protein
MLTSITPLGERGHRRRWAPTAACNVAGSTLGGAIAGAGAALVGAALGALTRPTPALVAALAGVACLLTLAAELAAGGRRLPTIRRQVNEDWLTEYRGWVCGLGFGVQLGLGMVTIVTTATVYLTFTLAALTAALPGRYWTGPALGAAFGLARALPILAVVRTGSPERLGQTARRLAAWAPLARRTAVVVALAAGLGFAAVGGVTG